MEKMVHKAVCDILGDESFAKSVEATKIQELELPNGEVVILTLSQTLKMLPPEATDGKLVQVVEKAGDRLLIADDGTTIYEAIRKAYEWEEANGGIPN